MVDDVLGADADAGLGFDPGAQLERAEGVQAVLRRRAVQVDRATQQQADLVGQQLPSAARPLLEGQLVSSARSLVEPLTPGPADLNIPANLLRCANVVSQGVPISGAYPAYARSCRSIDSNA